MKKHEKLHCPGSAAGRSARHLAQTIGFVLFACFLPVWPGAMAADTASITLTAAERAWLAENHTVRVRISEYPPYMFSKPMPAGMAVDYLTTIAQRLGFKVEFITGVLDWSGALQDVMGARQHYDLLPTMTPTPQREQQFALSKPYLTAPWVIYARKDAPYIIGLESLDGKVLAGEKGYVITEKLKSQYPNIRMHEVLTSAEALAAVATGIADAYVGNLANGTYLIRMHSYGNLVVAAPTPYEVSVQAMGVRKDWPELASLISKGIDNLTQEERNVISQKWGTVEFRARIDYALAYWILAIAGAVVLITLFWIRRLAKEVAVRKKTEQALNAANHTIRHANEALENRVAERTNELRAANVQLGKELAEHQQAKTALQKSEERFKALHNASFGGIAIHDKGEILECNQGLADITGYRVKELIGMDGLLLIAPSTRTLVRNNIATGYEKPYEAMGRRKNGEEFPLRLEARNIPYKGKNVRVVEFRDITEYKQFEAEREKMQDQLIQAQKLESIGRLAGGVAHDFNNMLGVILGYSEMVLEQIDATQPVYPAMQGIHQAAQRSAELTSQLLAFARKQTVMPKVLDLNVTVEGMLKMLRRLIGEDISLAWMPGKELGLVKIDPSQIDQILANLCVNARDAIGDTGKVTLETGNITFDADYCASHAGVLPGEYVMLAVSDNGCGMDAETLSLVFEPFFTTKEMGKGTGLGLATIHGIVKQNNGFINCYSEPGQGTSFKIYLPRYIAATSQAPSAKVAQPAATGLETILLVEDEPSILSMSAAMLNRLGYTVLAANTPAEALQLAQDHAGGIDLLMTDVVMPEMNGRDLAKKLLTLYPDLKCLFMSGYTANVIAHHGVLDEGVHFLQKPFLKKNLAAKLRETLDDSLPCNKRA